MENEVTNTPVQETNYQPETVRSKGKVNKQVVLGVSLLLGIFVLVVGSIAIFNMLSTDSTTDDTPAVQQKAETFEDEVDKIENQSESSEVDSIEKDLNATDIDTADKELKDIDKEISAQ